MLCGYKKLEQNLRKTHVDTELLGLRRSFSELLHVA